MKKKPISKKTPFHFPKDPEFFRIDLQNTPNVQSKNTLSLYLLDIRSDFLEMLSRRSVDEKKCGLAGLKALLGSPDLSPWHNTAFRALSSKTTLIGSLEIDGYANATEYELFSLLGVLLIDEHFRLIGDLEHPMEYERNWVTEGIAQIFEIHNYALKMTAHHYLMRAVGSESDKTFIFGTSKGVEGGNRLAGKATHKETDLLKDKVLKKFKLEREKKPLTGLKYGAWKSIPIASKALYEEFVEKGPRLMREGKVPALLLNKNNGHETIENWIYELTGAEKKPRKASVGPI